MKAGWANEESTNASATLPNTSDQTLDKGKKYKLYASQTNNLDIPQVLTEGSINRTLELANPLCNTIKVMKPTNKLKIKAKSPLKFTKTSNINSKQNPYPDEKLSQFETWRQMCLLYELQNSPHFDKFKNEIKKYKHPKQLATYESDVHPPYTPAELLHRNMNVNMIDINPNLLPMQTSNLANINDDFTNSLFDDYMPSQHPTLHSLLEKMNSFIPNTEPVMMPLQDLQENCT